MFKVGDKVRVVSKHGRETFSSVFNIGYIGVITEVKEMYGDVTSVRLDAKLGGWVDIEDLELVYDISYSDI